MRLIMHIGMGKTGTSSIQNTMRDSTEQLAAQKVHYLGMWMDMLGDKYTGFQGVRILLNESPEMQARLARDYAAHIRALAEETGAETFVFSNEAFFDRGVKIRDFFATLRDELDLKILAYMRDPHAWLPSAYAQWGIRHKTQPGPLQPFSQLGRQLLNQYEGIKTWAEDFDDVFELRLHDTSIDVVADFAQACGFEMDAGGKRYLERSEPAEVVMRAAFNARFDGEVLPNRFNRNLYGQLSTVPTLDDLSDLCFGQDGGAELVQERRELFDYISEKMGPEFDFSQNTAKDRGATDPAALRDRLVDYLIELTIRQGQRITALERKLEQE